MQQFGQKLNAPVALSPLGWARSLWAIWLALLIGSTVIIGYGNKKSEDAKAAAAPISQTR